MTRAHSPRFCRALLRGPGMALLTVLLAGTPEAPAQAPPELSPTSFACTPRSGAGRLRRGRDLVKIPVDAAVFPDAVCNDGTGAVFYVRRATDPAFADHWHVHLEGGGGCESEQSCANRWCRIGTNFGADLMSSAPTPPGIRANGIFRRSARNRFRGWNHVFVKYCSSDHWGGQRRDVDLLTAEDPSCVGTPGCPVVPFRIHFEGATIVDAVLDQLRRDCAGAACPAADYTYPDPVTHLPVEMPDLDAAAVVILSGTSAGSGGVRRLADQVGAALRTTNVNGAALDFRAILDTGIGLPLDSEDFTQACGAAGFCTCAGATCTYDEYMSGYDAAVTQGLYASRPEGSCESWHAADPWRCADVNHLALHHLTTPFFVRNDLQDELRMEHYSEPDPGFGTCDDFGVETEALLNGLFDPVCPLDCSAEEGAVEAITTPGVFGPQRGNHPSLPDRTFFTVRVMSGGVPYSFHDLAWNWFTGAAPQQVVHPFVAGLAAAPYCP